MIAKTRASTDTLEKLTEDDLDQMAAFLPTYPPLKPDGDFSVKEFHPDLTDEELDFLYKVYTEKYGGTMRKEGDWQSQEKPATVLSRLKDRITKE